MKVELSQSQKTIGIVITILLVLGGVSYKWSYDRDTSKLYSDNKVIAEHRFYVEMNRVYSIIKYSYQRGNCLDAEGMIRDYDNSKSRCYYPPNYYKRLNRKLTGTTVTELDYSEMDDAYNVVRNTPYYKYGTSGTVAGTLTENFFHLKDVTDIKDFPANYTVIYLPKDNTKYKLV